MVIVSQDKTRTVNYNNVCRIDVFKWGDGSITVDSVDISGFEAVLGEYKTLERAKEVLQEIIKEYKATEAFKACANRISDKVGAIAIEEGFSYEMPLE